MVGMAAEGDEVREGRGWVTQGFGEERVFCSEQRQNCTQMTKRSYVHRVAERCLASSVTSGVPWVWYWGPDLQFSELSTNLSESQSINL